MSTKIPTMGMAGWIDTIQHKAAYMISCFITSKYSQSVLFYGKITSLQYLVKKHANDLVGLETAISEAFEQKVRATFPNNATSSVVIELTDPNNPAIYTIRLSVDIVENGRTYSVGKLVQFKDSSIEKIMEMQ